MSKRKFPYAEARRIAELLVTHLAQGCERIEIAGSLRREKPQVGDIEILYIPKLQPRPNDLLGIEFVTYSKADAMLEAMLQEGELAKRPNAKGAFAWGGENKFGLHVPSGIPVDFFSTNAASWWNYLVCRTGGAATNMEIATRAQERGWKWHPTGSGFQHRDGRARVITSEREVFEFVGMNYSEPKERK